MNARLAAIRIALPDRVLDNHALAAQFPAWTADKILAKTGIRERRLAAEGECASDLACRAAGQLLRDLDINPEQVDFLLHCTETPDYLMPSTACLMQHRLGLSTRCGALDFNLGCSGYIYGLGLAKALIASGQAQTVLFTTADTLSKYLHPEDKSVRTLFGDAAAATLIQAGDADSLVGPFAYGTDGAGADHLVMPTGGCRTPVVPNPPRLEDDSGNVRTVNHLYLNGPEVFRFTLDVVPDVVARLLDQSGIAMADVDYFVFHQANQFMLEHLRRKLGIPPQRFHLDMEEVGNTVSSTIPIALRQAADQGRLRPGHLVMLVGFGVGFSWGATFIRWQGAEDTG